MTQEQQQEMSNEVVYIPATALPDPILKADGEGVVCLIPKVRPDWGTRRAGMRHYYHVRAPFKVRGGLRIRKDYYEQKILPRLCDVFKLPEHVSDLIPHEARKVIVHYFEYLKFYKYNDAEYKLTISKPATHFVAAIDHDAHSRAHSAMLEVFNADVIETYSTSTTLDSVITAIVKAPVDTDFYYIINEAPYRGSDSYKIYRARFSTDTDSFGLNSVYVESFADYDDAVEYVAECVATATEDEGVEEVR
ncbi:MAG: hypothetical protein ACXQT3_03855 [Methermicoccaceae archaeon]